MHSSLCQKCDILVQKESEGRWILDRWSPLLLYLMAMDSSDFPNVCILWNYSRKDIAFTSPLPFDAYVATVSELNGIAYKVCKYLLTRTNLVKKRSI
jgi:hypothetical protein